MARFFDFIAGAGIIQGMFIAILLFSGQRGRAPGNRLLAFLLLVLAASTAHPFFGPYLGPLKARVFMIDPMQTLLNPLIWLFVSARCSGDRFLGKDLLHFLPFAMVCAFLQLSPAFIRDIDGLAIGVSIAYWSLALIQAAVYFFKSYRAIAAYSRALEQSYSKVEAFKLEGLHAFMTIIIVLLAGRLIGLAILAHSESASHSDRLMELLQAFAVYFLGVFMALRREPVLARDAERLPQAEEKYGKSALSKEEVSRAFAQADARIREDKRYLDPELSLPALASAWGMNRNDLSRIINEGGGSSFYDFVNRHRIAEFKSLARDPEKRSWKILALAFEAGFNSKPAFNSAFKRLTGSTPSSWISSSRSD
jgi:AraC-like DNA-binding protein